MNSPENKQPVLLSDRFRYWLPAANPHNSGGSDQLLAADHGFQQGNYVECRIG